METRNISVTSMLKEVCEEYRAQIKWYRFQKINKHDAIAEKIIDYLDDPIANQNKTYLELTAFCLTYALQDVLIKLSSSQFLKILKEMIPKIEQHIRLTRVDIQKNKHTKEAVGLLAIKLTRKTDDLFFDVKAFENAWTLFVPRIHESNKNGFFVKIFSDGINNKNINEMELILNDERLSIFKEDIFYHAVKSLIYIANNILGRKFKNTNEWPETYFQFADLVFNHIDFNPNYISKTDDFTLLSLVLNSDNTYLINKFLNCPKTDFNAIKTWLKRDLDVPNQLHSEKLDHILLSNSAFFKSEPDWVLWANTNIVRPHKRKYFLESVTQGIHLNVIPSILETNGLPKNVVNKISNNVRHLYGWFAIVEEKKVLQDDVQVPSVMCRK